MEKKSKVKSILKKEPRAPNVMGVLPALHEHSDEHTPCEFCGMKYCSVGLHCVQRGNWIRGQKYDTWYHEVSIVAEDRKQFISEKCL
jgi:hypothetical protein